jgi:tetratricopeptide (TPR) repeat protein
MFGGISKIATLFLSVAIIAGGLISVYAIQNYLEAHRTAMPDEWVDEDLSIHGGRMRGFAFGAEGLLADWYWMRSLQYIGRKLDTSTTQVNIDDLRPLDPRLLYPYLDTATDLDPQFLPAYTYGAVVLPAIDPELAIKLTKKGIAENPDAWRLYQYLGYIYWKLDRYEEASATYAAGAKVAGAPPFMALMEAAMKTQGGNRDTAREIYTKMANDDSDSQTQDYARFRLMQLDSLDEQDAIREGLKSFQEHNGSCPNGWPQLLPTLKNVKVKGGRSLRIDQRGEIVDPSGVPYILKADTCDVSLNYLDTKVPTR